MKHYKVVCAIIENEKGEIFCCRRGLDKSLGGYWEFPGGKVEEHETYEETIIREIREELQSEIEPLHYLGESYYEYPSVKGFCEFAITLYGYKCKLVKGNLKLIEHIESKWATIQEMEMMEFAMADKPFIKKLIFNKENKRNND